MHVHELTPEHEAAVAHCLEEWSEEMREGAPLRQRWLDRMRPRGVRVQVAIDDDGEPVGMITYGPCEDTDVIGPGLYFVYCIWVHGHDEGVGNRQGRGIGTELLAAAEHDARRLGADGMVAWGLRIPAWMRASWFRKHGYVTAERRGLAKLVWKPFADHATPPTWREKHVRPRTERGKVVVTACNNGWCAGRNVAYERVRRAAAQLGEGIEIDAVDTSDPATLSRCGCMDALFIDGHELHFGPPPSYAKLRTRLAKRLQRTRRES